MTDDDTRCYEMFQRAHKFGNDEAANFASNAFVVGLYGDLAQVIGDVQTHAGAQVSGRMTARQHTQGKTAAREELLRALAAIARTARSMSQSVPGVEQMFCFNRFLKDQDLLTAARTIAANALPLKDEFVKRGLKPSFIDDLESVAGALEQSLALRTKQTHTHINATATISDLIGRGMNIVHELDSIMRNIFRGDAGKLAAWASASHVERAPHRRKPAPAPAAAATAPATSAPAGPAE